MGSNGKFEELIKQRYHSLSSAQKKAADYLFKNMDKSAFQTAVQIGMEAGVSDSSVIRLSYALGYASFSDMQHAMQEQFLDALQDANDTNSVQPLPESDDPIKALIRNEIKNFTELDKQLKTEDINKAADALIEANQVLVMGYFNSFSPAYEFFLRLSMLRPNVHFYRNSETESQRLYTLSKKSVVVAFSFPRHIKDTLSYIRQAKKQDATVISVTDNDLSPYNHESDISFMIDINSDWRTGFLSLSPAFILVYLLMMAIREKGGDEAQQHIDNLMDHYIDQDIYV